MFELTRPRFTLLTVLVTGICLSIPTQADEDEAESLYENWYQVEVLAFERTQTYSSAASEHWPNKIHLVYPYNLEHIYSEQEWQELNEKIEEESLDKEPFLDSLSADENASDATPPITTDLAPSQENFTSEDKDSIDPSTTISSDTLESDIDEDIVDTENTELPFIKLPTEVKLLNGQANTLQKREAYRVLYHESWRQPIQAANQAPSILILGGEQFGGHFELEGSIKISLARYLHVETNLWKSTFELNYGKDALIQENDNLEKYQRVELPPIPLSPLLVDANEEELTDYGATFSFDSSLAAQEQSLGVDLQSSFELFDSTYLTQRKTVDDSPYVVTETLLLRQKRRMRSNELHYIDHPRFGLLIKIVPYSGPDTEADQDA